MKRIFALLLIALPLSLSAQELTLLTENDSIPSLIERILQKHDSTRVVTGKHRNITSHINLEFVSSANAYFTDGKFDEMSFKMNRVRLEFVGKLNENLSYHFRQSFNKYTNPYSMDNAALPPASAVASTPAMSFLF